MTMTKGEWLIEMGLKRHAMEILYEMEESPFEGYNWAFNEIPKWFPNRDYISNEKRILLYNFVGWLRRQTWIEVDIDCWVMQYFSYKGHHYFWHSEDCTYYEEDDETKVFWDFPLKAYD